jgi:hypothetical protein
MKMAMLSTQSARRPFWTWVLRGMLCLSPLLSIWLLTGCNPASLAMVLMPFFDSKEQPQCKIATPNKETTVAIVTWFGNRELQMWPELMPADSELSERLAAILRDRYAGNKDKVKIVANAQVRNYQNKMVGDTWSAAEVGKRVKADKVIALEINSLSLYEKSTHHSQQLFRGNIEIAVKAYDLAKPAEEQVIFEEIYKRPFPRESPTDTFTSAPQFRAAYLTRVARELSKLFAAYEADERMHDMETD